MIKKIFFLLCILSFFFMLLSCDNTGHKHVWSNGTIIKEATCNEKGVIAYTCTDCGLSKIEDIPVDEKKHIWDDGYITKNPTIDENGIKKYTCSVCNKTKEEKIDKLEPNFLVESESQKIKLSDSINGNGNVETKDKIYSSLSMKTNSTPRWFLEGDTSAQQHLGIKNITEELGEHTSEEYYSYTFLIVNTSNIALTVKIHIGYSDVTNNVDKAVRVMTYNDDSEAIYIYQLADANIKGYAYYPACPNYFRDQGTVYDEYITIPATEDQSNPEYIKYSVFFWLEGQDDDCVEKIYNGTIKFSLNLSVEE